MKELYSKIYHNLQKIDFESIWHGFSPCEFALYDEHKVYFLDGTQSVDNRFLGNTSILYDGKPLAIWKVTNPKLQNPILLTAKIVHEMFHSFQKEQHEERFPDDLMMLSYPDDAVIHTIRQEENKLLASIFLEGDTSKKEAILQNFILLRKYRAEKVHNIIKQEFLSETIEGMAEYAGCMALKQLSPDHYYQVIQNNIGILAEPAPFFFDIRKMSYYTGSMLCLALSETDTSFYHEIGKESLSLFELISREVPPKYTSILPSPILVRMLEESHRQKEESLSSFLHTNLNYTSVQASICGYDPMNMWKLGDYLFCSHFVLLECDSWTEKFLKGPVALLVSDNCNHQIKGYFQRQ